MLKPINFYFINIENAAGDWIEAHKAAFFGTIAAILIVGYAFIAYDDMTRWGWIKPTPKPVEMPVLEKPAVPLEERYWGPILWD